jgi:hypothetical protein
MLNEQEQGFYRYWEANRNRKRRWANILFSSLPLGLLFALPMVLFFLIEGRRHSDIISRVDLTLICLGTFLIAIFYGAFRNYFQWERNEGKFQALKRKIESEASAEMK